MTYNGLDIFEKTEHLVWNLTVHMRRVRLARPRFFHSHCRWRDLPLLGIFLLIMLILVLRQKALRYFNKLSTYSEVDTLADFDWTRIETAGTSLVHVRNGGMHHHKVWILQFDEKWQVGLSELPLRDSCSRSLGAVETNVPSGAPVALAVNETVERVRRNDRVAPLIPLGRPFQLNYRKEREIVHVFALVMKGVFPRQPTGKFDHVLQPVDLIKETSWALNISNTRLSRRMIRKYCTKERAMWLRRAVSYAIRKLKMKGIVPKSNPMKGAKFNEAACCRQNVDATEDLQECGLQCDRDGLYNIISIFTDFDAYT